MSLANTVADRIKADARRTNLTCRARFAEDDHFHQYDYKNLQSTGSNQPLGLNVLQFLSSLRVLRVEI